MPRKKKHTGGSPPHVPGAKSRLLVVEMTMAGIPQPQIALVVGVSVVTLLKHYREEIDTAVPEANRKMSQSLFLQGMGHHVAVEKVVKKQGGGEEVKIVQEYIPPIPTSTIFWLKCRAMWKDQPKEINLTVDETDAEPIDIRALARAVLSLMSEAKLQNGKEQNDGHDKKAPPHLLN